MADRLYRSETDKIIGGVCGGLAEYMDIDPSLIRIITLVLVFSGISPLFYLIAWLIIPSESEVKGTTETSSSREQETQQESGEEDRNDLDYESPDKEDE